MAASLRTPWARWTYAAKPASWPKLLVPAFLGQALGVAHAGRLDAVGFALGMAFTLALLLFIVFWNDYFDRHVDRIKREMFPNGGSPKTIPDGILPRAALLAAGGLAGLFALGLAWLVQSQLHRELALPAAVICLAIFVAYSLPPIRLNYRGGGEWLEMMGVGLALPLFEAYVQCGVMPGKAPYLLPGLLLLSLASAIASGLSDERSDARGGKRTFATTRGNAAARGRVESLVLFGALAWAAGAHLSGPGLPRTAAWLAVAIVVINWRRMRSHSPRAKTDAFAAQGRYKRVLHHAIWRGASCLALGLLWGALR